MNIPEQLRNERFTLLRGKVPFEKEWQDKNNHRADSQKLLAHLKNGGNYGVLCGHNNLVVVDYDSDEAIQKYEHLLPSTFTVRTKKGKHAYYYLDEPINKIPVNDEEGNRLVDIQGLRSQVVGPGSTHPEGGKYEVIKDEPITEFSKDELLKIFPHTDKKVPNSTVTGKYELPKPEGLMDLAEVVSLLGHNLKDGLNNCPFHPDKTPSFSVDYSKGSFNCFSCDARGNSPVTYVMLAKGCSKEDAIKWLTKNNPNKQNTPSKKKKEVDKGETLALLQSLKEKGGSVKKLYDRGIPEVKWKIPQLLSDEGKMIVFGASGTGKSFSAMQLGLATTNKLLWLAYHEVPQQKIMYFDGEMGLKPFFHNLKKLITGYDCDYPRNFIYYPTSVLSLDDQKGYDVVRQLIDEHRPDIVVLDTIRCFLSGGEDKPEEFKRFIEHLDKLSDEFGVAWVMLQHMPKNSVRRKGPPQLEDIYGSVAQGGWLDSAIALKKLGLNTLGVYHPKLRLVSQRELTDYEVVIPSDEGSDRYSYRFNASITESSKVQTRCYDDCLDFLTALVKEGRTDVKGREWSGVREKYSDGTFYRVRDSLKDKGYLSPGDNSATLNIEVDKFVDEKE